MKRLFIIGLLVGFAGLLAAAHFVPWVRHVRLPSQTSVVANGGRAERFVIRLPADRIHAMGPVSTGLRSSGFPALATIPGQDATALPLLEHFKVRDSAGNVIGIAARHWTVTPAGPRTSWMLAIPSRGSLVLVAPGEAPGVVDAALTDRGYTSGSPWTGELSLAMVGDGATAAGVVGSREFAGLDVAYTETWNITGIGESGELRGTIELDTVSRRGG
jgi:hypothetical protein